MKVEMLVDELPNPLIENNSIIALTWTFNDKIANFNSKYKKEKWCPDSIIWWYIDE